MAFRENVTHELENRLKGLGLGKIYLSVRFEPATRVVRVGACISNYDWDHRSTVVDALLDFEDSHEDEFALEFDVLPFDTVHDPEYAEI